MSEKTELELAKQKLNSSDPAEREKAQQTINKLREKDIASDKKVIEACGNGNAGSAGCASARLEVIAAKGEYENTGNYNPDGTENTNLAANTMAHAVAGAVLAQIAGGSAAAGAAGAAGGELAAKAMVVVMYLDTKISDLTESQKQTVSALSQMVAGLAGGIASDSSMGAGAGATAGKNAVGNNALSGLDGLGKGMMDYGQATASWNQYAEAKGLTSEQKQAGLDKLTKGDLPEGDNITKVIVDGYKDGVLMAGAGYLGPAASAGKVIGGAVIAEIANGSYQWFDLNKPGNENKTWDYKGSVSAGITGALAPGRGIGQNVGIAAGGAIFADGPDAGAVGSSAASAWVGGMFGEYVPGVVNSLTGKEVPGFIFDAVGSVGSEFLDGYTKDLLDTPNGQNISEKENGGKE